MTDRISNPEYFTLLGAGTSIGGNGWEVIVKSHTDFSTIIAYLNFQSLTFSNELNGPGGGSITLSLDDPVLQADPPLGVATDILNYECLFEVYQDGVLRSQFLGATITEKMMDPSTNMRTVTISGPGPAEVLRWAITLHPGYPDPAPPYYHTFVDKTLAYQWLNLLGDAQDRGTIDYVSTSFTDTLDSSGVAWSDSSDIQQANGVTLYDLLEQHAATLEADWYMSPGFVVNLSKTYGTHKESSVAFYEGSYDSVSKERVRDRSEIYNVVVARDAYGATSESTSSDSQLKWQRREFYVDAGNALSNTARSNVAKGALAQYRLESSSWTIKVRPDGANKVVFDDYDVGDWIGIENSTRSGSSYTVTAYRVMAISMSIDSSGVVDLELILETKRQLQLKRLKLRADKASGAGSAATASAPVTAEFAAAASTSSISLDGLSDVSAGSPTPGDSVVWTGTQWVNSPLTLDMLGDVDVSSVSPAPSDILTWNAVSEQWEPAAPSAGSVTVNAGYGSAYGTLERSYSFTSSIEDWIYTPGGNGSISASGGALKITNTSTGLFTTEPVAAGYITDGEAVVDLVTPGTAGEYFDVIFRYVSSSNNYRLRITMQGSTSSGVAFYKTVSGVTTLVGYGLTYNGFIGINSRIRVLVRFVGSKIWAYIDGSLVGAWDDSSLTEGRIGAYNWQVGESASLYLDQVSVYSLPSTWNHSSVPEEAQPGMQGPAAWDAVTEWSDAVAYTDGPPADVVTYDGETYVALAGSTDVEPGTDPATWHLLASKGTTGDTGATGATGPAAWSSGLPTWSVSTSYTAGPPADVVAYDGSCYLALAASTGVEPGTDPTKWALLAERGSVGVSASGAYYRFSTTTTDADPGDGYLRLSNATQNASTVIRVDSLTSDAVDFSTFLGTIASSTSTVKGHVRIAAATNTSDWILFSISAVSDQTGYFNITVSPVAYSSANPFVLDQEVVIAFVRTGDKGDTGLTGATGDSGGGIYIPYVFSTTTTDADPGNGYLRLSSATQNTSTAIRADLLDSNGSAWTNVIDAFDDSTSTLKGHIRLHSLADPSKFLLFTVTSVGSETGYRNITVTCIGSSAASPFTNAETVILNFDRTGDKGNTGATGEQGAPGPASYSFSVPGTLTTTTAGCRRYNNTGRTLTITGVQVAVDTAPTGASIVVGIYKNGTTILAGTPLEIAVGGNTGSVVPSTASWPNGEYLQVVIEQVGSTIAGAYLTGEVLAS